jgi:hypothetical protein
MPRELKSLEIEDIHGETIEFWYYAERTVAQHLAIEQMLEKRGGTQTALLLSAFIVCALDADGKRLFSDVEYKQLAGRLSQSELVKACLAMGNVEETDPKA